MRLSEARIRKLAKAMVREMTSRGAIKTQAGPGNAADVIAKTLIIDQRLEEHIESEARAMLERQRNLPPPGTGEYQAAFQQAKRQIASRRGFPL